MNDLDVPKRVHIVPLGYELDRIVRPVVDGNADEVILLEPDADREDVDRPSYHETARQRVRDEGIRTETVECDIFNLFSSLGTIAEISNRLCDHNVYVNLASGSKVTAIGGMIACMVTGAIPYYVRAEEYAGGEERPVASGAKPPETLPKYPIEEPNPERVAVLAYVERNQPVTKRDLIDHGRREGLPFVERYDTEGVQNPKRGYYRRLNTHVVRAAREPRVRRDRGTLQVSVPVRHRERIEPPARVPLPAPRLSRAAIDDSPPRSVTNSAPRVARADAFGAGRTNRQPYPNVTAPVANPCDTVSGPKGSPTGPTASAAVAAAPRATRERNVGVRGGVVSGRVSRRPGRAARPAAPRRRPSRRRPDRR